MVFSLSSIRSAFLDRYAVVQQFTTYWPDQRSATLEEGMNNDMHCIITQTLQQYPRKILIIFCLSGHDKVWSDIGFHKLLWYFKYCK